MINQTDPIVAIPQCQREGFMVSSIGPSPRTLEHSVPFTPRTLQEAPPVSVKQARAQHAPSQPDHRCTHSHSPACRRFNNVLGLWECVGLGGCDFLRFVNWEWKWEWRIVDFLGVLMQFTEQKGIVIVYNPPNLPAASGGLCDVKMSPPHLQNALHNTPAIVKLVKVLFACSAEHSASHP